MANPTTATSFADLKWPLNLVPETERDVIPDTILVPVPLEIWMYAFLGEGSSGKVFAGLFGGRRIAAKLLGTMTQRQAIEELALQLGRWQNLHHSHILPFVAKCDLPFRQVALLSPYMENGNLMDFIKRYPSEDRLRLLKQVAEGVHYLHTEADIVHGDLKCANILVSENRAALVGDFGLSTIITKREEDDPTKTYLRARHTVPFAAPELFVDTAMHTSSDTRKLIKRSKTKYSDVYAFGMLIYEAITGITPWVDLSSDDIARNVIAGARPTRTEQFCDDLWKLCESCWEQAPSSRPDITKVLSDMTFLVDAKH